MATVTTTTASTSTRAGATSRLGWLEGKLSWILLGLAGLLLPLLDDSYIGVIAQRATSTGSCRPA
jgi:branched-chain amino acid transport system permease protein